MRVLIPLFLVWAESIAFCEPPRAAELFGSFGTMRGGDDEGSAGASVLYGGAATVPFAARWALDIQALASPLSDRPDYRLHRVLLSPGLQYRRGNDRSFWFIAFGPGMQLDARSGTGQVFDGIGGSRPFSFKDTETGLTLHWRSGAVFQPKPRVLVRGEFFWVNRYALPSVGVAVSIGFRLGR